LGVGVVANIGGRGVAALATALDHNCGKPTSFLGREHSEHCLLSMGYDGTLSKNPELLEHSCKIKQLGRTLTAKKVHAGA
jgi:hypothetical protein